MTKILQKRMKQKWLLTILYISRIINLVGFVEYAHKIEIKSAIFIHIIFSMHHIVILLIDTTSIG